MWNWYHGMKYQLTLKFIFQTSLLGPGLIQPTGCVRNCGFGVPGFQPQPRLRHSKGQGLVSSSTPEILATGAKYTTSPPSTVFKA